MGTPVSRAILLAMLALALVCGCYEKPKPVNLPPVIEATTLGVGDVFIMHIVGEDKLPTEFTVAPDGTIDVPYFRARNTACQGKRPQRKPQG